MNVEVQGLGKWSYFVSSAIQQRFRHVPLRQTKWGALWTLRENPVGEDCFTQNSWSEWVIHERGQLFLGQGALPQLLFSTFVLLYLPWRGCKILLGHISYIGQLHGSPFVCKLWKWEAILGDVCQYIFLQGIDFLCHYAYLKKTSGGLVSSQLSWRLAELWVASCAGEETFVELVGLILPALILRIPSIPSMSEWFYDSRNHWGPKIPLPENYGYTLLVNIHGGYFHVMKIICLM